MAQSEHLPEPDPGMPRAASPPPPPLDDFETRWTLAEQRFLESFFGKDVILRTRQRRHQRRSPTKVSFNMAANIRYDFHPCPTTAFKRTTSTLKWAPRKARSPRQGRLGKGGATDEEIDDDDDDEDDEDDGKSDLAAANAVPSDRLGRIVRPRTADLSKDQQARLHKFRELDTIAFIKPNSGASRGLTPRVGSVTLPGGTAASAGNGAGAVGPVTRGSTRLLSARTATTNSASVVGAISIREALGNASRVPSPTRAASAFAFNSLRSRRPPVELLDGGLAVPRRRRPLSKAARRLMMTALEEALFPSFGRIQVGGIGAGGSGTVSKPATAVDFNSRHVAVTPKSRAGLRRQLPTRGLHHYLNPPRLPAAGLSVTANVCKPDNPFGKAASEVKVHVPTELRET
ncbi:hypothetical protein HK101_001325, partial [Irineochytrium annulatum]